MSATVAPKTESKPKPTLKELAARLEYALDMYVIGAAVFTNADGSEVANALSDRWGGLRFYCAEKLGAVRAQADFYRDKAQP